MSSIEVLCVVWAPDGSNLVSGGGFGDNKIKLWLPTPSKDTGSFSSFRKAGSLLRSPGERHRLHRFRGGEA